MTTLTSAIRSVSIERSSSGYGFSIHRQTGKSGHYIQNVDVGGAAALAGLKAGDYIIEINNIIVEDKEHGEVVAIIKSGGNRVTFLVADNAEIASKRHEMTSVTRTEVITSISRKTITIQRSPGVSYGFTLREDSDGKGHVVTQVVSGSPSEMAGLTVGDHVVDINGTGIRKLGTKEVVEIIKGGGDKVIMSIEVTEEASKIQPIPTITGSKVITVKRGSKGFGFSVKDMTGRNGHIIDNVEPGLPADVAGLRNNDYVIEVNGLNVEQFTLQEVVTAIKDAGDSITFVVCDANAAPFVPRAPDHQRNNGADEKAAEEVAAATVVAAVAAAATPVATPTTAPAEVATATAAAASVETAATTAPAEATAVTTAAAPAEAVAAVSTESTTTEAVATTAAVAATAEVIAEASQESKPVSVPNGANKDTEKRTVTMHRGPKGFGFSLQCEKGQRGNYVQSVEPNSVASDAGLKDGDRVLETNGKNVESSSHAQVVEIIKAGGDTVTFVVVDKEIDFKQRQSSTKAVTNVPPPHELVFDDKQRLLSKIFKHKPVHDGNWQSKVDSLNML